MTTDDNKRHYVMNDDIIGLIFNKLSAKQLCRLQTVCRQFKECSEQTLKNKSWTIRVGHQKDDTKNVSIVTINHMIIRTDNIFDLVESHQQFDSILKNFAIVRTIQMSLCYINRQTIEKIVNRCPHLQRLELCCIYMKTSDDEELRQMASLLSKIKYLSFRCVDDSRTKVFTIDLIKELSSLESLRISTFFNHSIVEQIVTYFPQTLRSLHLIDNNWRLTSLETIINRCPHLDQLSIEEMNYFMECNDIFINICCKLNLKNLAFRFNNLSIDVFSKYIVKQTQLKTLSITSDMCFDVTKMKTMNSLKTIKLYWIRCLPKLWSNLPKVFPNLSHISFDEIVILCECNEDQPQTHCRQCQHKCMQSIAQLTHLKRLSLTKYYNRPVIGTDDLKLFSELNVLSLRTIGNQNRDEIVDELIQYCKHCAEKRVSQKCLKVMTNIEIRKPLEQRLKQSFAEMNQLIPKFLKITNLDDFGCFE
ncbi:uncharacterized protein LOC128958729 [Oppia nitens]|uniref:uncharacterized protein LOC128958729 n=1 Tax=Oppia nitens TaxID=1686743 RepID=UPI0023DA4E25|nr:uncharacterized protein LOC128958729 [Oppia nitens]